MSTNDKISVDTIAKLFNEFSKMKVKDEVVGSSAQVTSPQENTPANAGEDRLAKLEQVVAQLITQLSSPATPNIDEMPEEFQDSISEEDILIDEAPDVIEDEEIEITDEDINYMKDNGFYHEDVEDEDSEEFHDSEEELQDEEEVYDEDNDIEDDIVEFMEDELPEEFTDEFFADADPDEYTSFTQYLGDSDGTYAEIEDGVGDWINAARESYKNDGSVTGAIRSAWNAIKSDASNLASSVRTSIGGVVKNIGANAQAFGYRHNALPLVRIGNKLNPTPEGRVIAARNDPKNAAIIAKNEASKWQPKAPNGGIRKDQIQSPLSTLNGNIGPGGSPDRFFNTISPKNTSFGIHVKPRDEAPEELQDEHSFEEVNDKCVKDRMPTILAKAKLINPKVDVNKLARIKDKSTVQSLVLKTLPSYKKMRITDRAAINKLFDAEYKLKSQANASKSARIADHNSTNKSNIFDKSSKYVDLSKIYADANAKLYSHKEGLI